MDSSSPKERLSLLQRLQLVLTVPWSPPEDPMKELTDTNWEDQINETARDAVCVSTDDMIVLMRAHNPARVNSS